MLYCHVPAADCILPLPTTPCLQVEAALRTGLCLRNYEDILDPAEVWAFLALAAFYAKFYGTCSKASATSWLGSAAFPAFDACSAEPDLFSRRLWATCKLLAKESYFHL